MSKDFFTLIMEGMALMEQDGEKKGFRWGRAALGAAALGAAGALGGGYGKLIHKTVKHTKTPGKYMNKKMLGAGVNVGPQVGARFARRNYEKIVRGMKIGGAAGIGAGAGLGFTGRKKMTE